jgi:hypothetical protein
MRRTLAWIIGGLPLVALAAPDGCKVLVHEDVVGTLGKAYADVAPQNLFGDRNTCAFQRSAADLAGIVLFEAPGGAAASLKGLAEMVGRNNPVTPVDGLGTGAFVVTGGGRMGLHFGRGNVRMTLEVQSGGKPDVQAAIRLARAVYARPW